ncbi:hypothetical protein CLV63_10395 [Murinocardiopsis flavida]|uniref:Uncharacterized protein n=1 Tax=Murinocardiopsis flavida TaxID=645275 RepID=A0A2P8DQA6_9ACTN|nr:hypothetical protein [Murinocardiopsis flavida]PSK99372.1 hypothetical protein CLV63_10395 [Murinocardiopsis flavida]
MAHHAAGQEATAGDFLPRGPLARALLFAVLAIVIGSLVLALWATGGLAKAPDAPPSAPGRPISNELFTVTPHSATVTIDKDKGPEPVLEIRADLVTKVKEPVEFGALNGIIAPSIQPGKARVKSIDVLFERNPEGLYTELQPQVSEKVLLTWPLPKKVAPDSVESVALTIWDAQKTGGFWDERERWGAGEERVGTVEIPVERG